MNAVECASKRAGDAFAWALDENTLKIYVIQALENNEVLCAALEAAIKETSPTQQGAPLAFEVIMVDGTQQTRSVALGPRDAVDAMLAEWKKVPEGVPEGIHWCTLGSITEYILFNGRLFDEVTFKMTYAKVAGEFGRNDLATFFLGLQDVDEAIAYARTFKQAREHATSPKRAREPESESRPERPKRARTMPPPPTAVINLVSDSDSDSDAGPRSPRRSPKKKKQKIVHAPPPPESESDSAASMDESVLTTSFAQLLSAGSSRVPNTGADTGNDFAVDWPVALQAELAAKEANTQALARLLIGMVPDSSPHLPSAACSVVLDLARDARDDESLFGTLVDVVYGMPLAVIYELLAACTRPEQVDESTPLPPGPDEDETIGLPEIEEAADHLLAIGESTGTPSLGDPPVDSTELPSANTPYAVYDLPAYGDDAFHLDANPEKEYVGANAKSNDAMDLDH